jgi:hypothetical protein
VAVAAVLDIMQQVVLAVLAALQVWCLLLVGTVQMQTIATLEVTVAPALGAKFHWQAAAV